MVQALHIKDRLSGYWQRLVKDETENKLLHLNQKMPVLVAKRRNLHLKHTILFKRYALESMSITNPRKDSCWDIEN